jgi:phosphatidylglycerol---prolipoprotein diacylglyceryl transferase
MRFFFRWKRVRPSKLGRDVIINPHPTLHPVFETLGYACGFAWYRWDRSRRGDTIADEQRWIVIAAAAVGGLLGSRFLGLLEQAPRLTMTWKTIFLPGGKTIVGGLIGGWLAVEVVKRLNGIRTRTGDLLVIPLCIGIAIGRVGCFLAGLADDTYGKPTRLPWGVDFGDGIARHPTQLYEILFLAFLAIALGLYDQRTHLEGATFRLFLTSYLAWRLAIDFLKPQPLLSGMSLIQWSCFAGLVALMPSLLQLSSRRALVRSLE